jgi:hypothetical protein
MMQFASRNHTQISKVAFILISKTIRDATVFPIEMVISKRYGTVAGAQPRVIAQIAPLGRINGAK